MKLYNNSKIKLESNRGTFSHLEVNNHDDGIWFEIGNEWIVLSRDDADKIICRLIEVRDSQFRK